MQVVESNINEKMLDLNLICKILRHGYEKAYRYSIGNEYEISFLEIRKNKSGEELLNEYRELISLLHSS